MAARFKVIILERTRDDADTIKYIMWVDVPAGREIHYADTASPPTRVSAWPDAIASDNTALQNGTVVERVTTLRSPAGTPINQVQTTLQQNWQVFQTEITNANPWQRYGSTWDGTTWTVANNP